MNRVQISEKEMALLQIIIKHRGGTANEIHSKLPNGTDFIAILRCIHVLHKKGLLLQIRTGSESTYKVSDKGLDVAQ